MHFVLAHHQEPACQPWSPFTGVNEEPSLPPLYRARPSAATSSTPHEVLFLLPPASRCVWGQAAPVTEPIAHSD